jgi:alanyl-tRNA synthetase
VDAKRRSDIMKNHSATHLLHHALREVLGTHVEQKGSLVGPDYLRFDFSHFSKISDDEMSKIVRLLEQQIKDNLALKERRNAPIEEAKSMGAMALFGEKYGEFVRVIQFGDSVELCGGTHVDNTNSIGLVKIQSESAVAAGIRRIEMITGSAAEAHYKEETALLNDIRILFKNPKDIIKSVQDLMESNSKIAKEVESLMKARSIQIKNGLMSEITEVGDLNILCKQISLDSNSVKDILFQLKGQVDRFIGIIGNTDGDKCGLSVIISDSLVEEKQWSAVQWIREAAPLIQGGGGGQPFFATAGGKNAAGLNEALTLIKRKI